MMIDGWQREQIERIAADCGVGISYTEPGKGGFVTDNKKVKENKITTYQNIISAYATLKDDVERVIDAWDAYAVITDMAVNDDGTIWAEYEVYMYDDRYSDTFTFPIEWLDMNDMELKAAITNANKQIRKDSRDDSM